MDEGRATSKQGAQACAAFVPLALAIVGGDVAANAKAMRDVVVGATLAGDHAWTAPLPQLLVPIATLLPLGDVHGRAAVAMSIPASIAAALVTRRAALDATTLARTTIALAVGALAGVLLARSDPTAALVVVACELVLATMERRTQRTAALSIAASLLALWATPRLGWIVIVPWALCAKDRFRACFFDGFLRAAPFVVVAILVALVRGAGAWIVLGRPLVDGSAARSTEPLLAAGVETRTAIAAAVLTVVAVVAVVAGGVGRAASSARKLALVDRAAALTAIAALGAAWLLRPFGGAAVAICVVLPIAGATLGALHLAVERFVDARIDRRARPFRVLTWIVPALAIGASARALEDDARARHVGADVAAAAGFSGVSTLGAAPANAVLLVDDEPRLVRWAHERTILALRPDVRVLPAQALLLGGAATLAARTLDELPAASNVLRAMIAHGELDEPDVSPLTEHAPLLVAVSASRVRTLARHFDATGAAIVLELERVDPSDRRIHRAALDRRLRFVVDALATSAVDDPLRALLRGDALREARVASFAADREAALHAITRARTLGAPSPLVDAWTEKIQEKKTLENEPEIDN